MRRGGGARDLPPGDPRQRMLTPPEILEPIRELLGGIALDPCTEADNPTGAERFFTIEDDGLAQLWDFRNVYCNPPYGRARKRWVERCAVEGRDRAVLLLIPSHTEVELVQRFAAVRKNGRRETASHGSVLLSSIDLSPLRHLGVVMGRR